jgi:hypothetical protein
LQLFLFDPVNQQPAPILKDAFLNAILSSDYSNKSAKKNPITSRPDSGSDRIQLIIRWRFIMKSILKIIVVVLALMSPTLYAGSAATWEVSISFDTVDSGEASGNMWSVRSSKNDVESIGCSYKGVVDAVHYDWMPWDHAVNQWSWCWALDADGVQARCFTKDKNLLAALQAISPFSYIRFEFTDYDVASNIGLCTRFDFSTQSRHLPNFNIKK